MAVFKKENWKIIKNPGSLKGFGKNVRGVITSEGDLYLESSATEQSITIYC